MFRDDSSDSIGLKPIRLPLRRAFVDLSEIHPGGEVEYLVDNPWSGSPPQKPGRVDSSCFGWSPAGPSCHRWIRFALARWRSTFLTNGRAGDCVRLVDV